MKISRLFLVSIVLVMLIAMPMATEYPWLMLGMKSLGFIAVVVASLGRIWCSLYLCGYKNQSVVDTGPYSVVRNPLYVFSCLGATGTGLATGSFSIVLLIICFFIFLYPSLISNEESRLAAIFGDSYENYRRSTLSIIPNFQLFRYTPQYTIHMKSVHAAFKDVVWFFLAWFVAQLTATMHLSGILPDLLVIL